MSATLEWEGGTTAAKGTCQGDSGGPALDSIGASHRYRLTRGPSVPAMTRSTKSVVGAIGEWIRTKAAQAAADGNYTAAGWVKGASTSDSANGYCPNGGGAGGGGGNTGGGEVTRVAVGNTGGGGGARAVAEVARAVAEVARAVAEVARAAAAVARA